MTRDELLELAKSALKQEAAAKALRASCVESEALARKLEAEAQDTREAIRLALWTEGSLGFEAEGLMVSRVSTPSKVELAGEVDEKQLTWKGAPLPGRYIALKRSLNRALLSADMKAGQAVGFARLVTGETLKIEHLVPGSEPEQEFA